MAKKMSKKEEMFWQDLACRMASYIGCQARKKTIWIHGKRSDVCQLIDTTTFSWTFSVITTKRWKDLVRDMCNSKCYHASLSIEDSAIVKHRRFFEKLFTAIKTGKDKEKYIIEAELAGLGDLVKIIERSKNI